MTRYEIALGKKPPKVKALKRGVSEVERTICIGNRRSGKTLTLLKEMLKTLSACPTNTVGFCSFNLDTTKATVKELCETAGHATPYSGAPSYNFNSTSTLYSRIGRLCYGDLVRGNCRNFSGLYLDNIDMFDIKGTSIFAVLSATQQYPRIPKIYATCDENRFRGDSIRLINEQDRYSTMVTESNMRNALENDMDYFFFNDCQWNIIRL